MQDEQSRLDQILAEPDPLLVASLREDEKRRRRWKMGILAGLLIAAAGATTAAILLFRPAQLTAADVARANALNIQGWRAWQQGQMAQAITIFEEAVKTNPQAAHAWNGLGWTHFHSGNYDLADEALHRCLRLMPNHGGALNGIGQIALVRRDYAKAETYLAAAASDPEAAAAHWGLAKLYLLKGQYDSATTWAQKIVDASPNDADAAELLAAAKAGKLNPDLRKKIEPDSR